MRQRVRVQHCDREHDERRSLRSRLREPDADLERAGTDGGGSGRIRRVALLDGPRRTRLRGVGGGALEPRVALAFDLTGEQRIGRPRRRSPELRERRPHDLLVRRRHGSPHEPRGRGRTAGHLDPERFGSDVFLRVPELAPRLRGMGGGLGRSHRGVHRRGRPARRGGDRLARCSGAAHWAAHRRALVLLRLGAPADPRREPAVRRRERGHGVLTRARVERPGDGVGARPCRRGPRRARH